MPELKEVVYVSFEKNKLEECIQAVYKVEDKAERFDALMALLRFLEE